MRRAILLSFLLLTFALNAFSKDGYVTVSGGAKLFYEEYGEGEPVIFLHGHTLDRRMWMEQVKLLKNMYRVIVPDLRGYGKSDDPEVDFQFTYADDVIAFMDSLGIGKAHIVGLSMGGYVAGDMLAYYPHRMISCMMVAGEICARPGPSQPKTAQEKYQQQQSNKFQLKNGLDYYKRQRVESLIKRAGSRGEEMRPCLTEMIMDWGAWQVLHHTVRVYYGKDAMAKLKMVCPKVPTVLIYGEKETTNRSKMMDYLPNGSQLFVPDCGHMVNMEQPEWFNRTLLDWLQNHSLQEK